MKLLSKSGERIYKAVTIRVISGKNRATRIIRAPMHKGFTCAQVDEVLRDFSQGLENSNKHLSFRLVPVGPAHFNIIGEKMVAPGTEDQMRDTQCAYCLSQDCNGTCTRESETKAKQL